MLYSIFTSNPRGAYMKNRLYYGDNLDILRNREYFPR